MSLQTLDGLTLIFSRSRFCIVVELVEWITLHILCHFLIASQVLQGYDPPSLRDITNELLSCLSDIELIDPILGNFLESPAKALPLVSVPFLPNIPGPRVDENFPIAGEFMDE